MHSSHQTQQPCPRCSALLFVGHARDSVVHGCGHCGGMWLDAQTSERVVQTACQATIGLSQQAAQIGRAKVEQGAQHQLPCPMCRQLMRTTRVANAWLDVDVCQSHGVWYDRGELERVARATQRGNVSDWRNVRPPPVAGTPDSAATGAAVAGAAVVGAAGAGYAAHSVGEEVAGEWVGEVAAEVGTELAVEGVFALLGALFD